MNEHPAHEARRNGPQPAPPDAPPPTGGDGGPGHGGSSFAARYGLVRPLHGRYLGGVCAAVGRATNTDPVLWRVLLAVTSFFGIGILIYLAGWLLTPAEGDTASPVEALLGRGRSRTSPVLVIVLGGLGLLVLGFMLTDGFRGPLLIVAVVVGGVLLLSRASERGQAEAAGHGAGSAEPATAAPVPPTGPDDAGHQPAAEPYGAAYAAPPGTPVSTAVGGPAAPPRPSAYRPPFAPRGPYPPTRPGAHPAGGPATPPHPPVTHPPHPPQPPKPPRERSRLGILTLSLVLLALGAVAALDLANVVDVRVGGYFAAALAMVGLGLVLGAWFGRARWLMSLGLVLAVALGAAGAAERLDVQDFGSDTVWRPTSLADLADRYNQNLGSATLDLRQVDFTGQAATVEVGINAGELEVMLPPNVDTTVETRVNAGDAQIFDTRWSGLNTPARTVTDLGGGGGGELRLDIRVNAGHVEVHR